MYVVVVMSNNDGQDVQDVHGLYATREEAETKLEALKAEDKAECERYGEGEPDESDFYGEVVELTSDQRQAVVKRRRANSRTEVVPCTDAVSVYNHDLSRSKSGVDPLGDLYLMQIVRTAKFDEMWPELELNQVIDAVQQMPEAQRQTLMDELRKRNLV